MFTFLKFNNHIKFEFKNFLRKIKAAAGDFSFWIDVKKVKVVAEVKNIKALLERRVSFWDSKIQSVVLQTI